MDPCCTYIHGLQDAEVLHWYQKLYWFILCSTLRFRAFTEDSPKPEENGGRKAGAKRTMMGWNNMMGAGGVFGGGLVSLLILAAIVAGIVLLVRNANRSGGPRSDTGSQEQYRPRQTAIEILETRYAKGEIDKEEYESRRRDLEPSSAGLR
jgi:putative membrane protein